MSNLRDAAQKALKWFERNTYEDEAVAETEALRTALAEQADDARCRELLEAFDDAPEPKPAEQEPGNWIVYNSGAEVASGLSLTEALEYLTPERLARQWCAVCVVDQSNLPKTPQPKPAEQESILSETDVAIKAEALGIDPNTPGLYAFYVDCISSLPRPAQQEPVAWIMPEHLRHQGKSFTRWIQDGSTKPPIYEGWTPLYTAPQPAKREQLTDEEIWDAVWNCDDNRFAVARAIERAHGIGGQT